MREIIHIQVGQCGNQVGKEFLETICDEHSINCDTGILENDSLTKNILVYFNEISHYKDKNKKFIPRAILVDLEPGPIQQITSSSKINNLLSPDNCIYGNNSAANVWAKGYYTEGAELIDQILNRVRHEVENCDLIQGFQLVHSIGGGTGSGLGSLIIDKLREEYDDRIITTYSVMPSTVSNSVLEPYNCIFTLNQLTESADMSICYDNKALEKIFFKYINEPDNKFKMNKLISLVMSNVTASLRFPGQLNSDLRKYAGNLIPFPRLHFLINTIAPLPLICNKINGVQTNENIEFKNNLEKNLKYRKTNDLHSKDKLKLEDLTRDIFDDSNILLDCSLQAKKYLTAAALYRGSKLYTHSVESYISKMLQKDSEKYADFIPDNIQTVLCNVAPAGFDNNIASMIGNNTVFGEKVKFHLSQFEKMFKSKSYLHYYIGEGMDIDEFKNAIENTYDLINEYQILN